LSKGFFYLAFNILPYGDLFDSTKEIQWCPNVSFVYSSKRRKEKKGGLREGGGERVGRPLKKPIPRLKAHSSSRLAFS